MQEKQLCKTALRILLLILLTTGLMSLTLTHALVLTEVRVPGGIVSSDDDFSEALGGNVMIGKDHKITLLRDVILEAPLIIRGGEYVFDGAGCRIIRGFEDGDLIVVSDKAKVEFGVSKKESDDASLMITGGIVTKQDLTGGFSYSLEIDTGIDPEKVDGALVCVTGSAEVTVYFGTELYNNHSVSNGGGIVCEGGSLILASSVVKDCSSDADGGCVYVGKDGSFSMLYGEVSGGISRTGGGNLAIAHGGEAVISSGTLSNGCAVKNGGGIYAEGELLMQECTVTGNKAEKGGGIYYAGDNTVTSASVSENEADFGGGIYHAAGELKLIAIGAEDNRAIVGAGLYNAATVVIDDCMIGSNTATGEGGGIYNASNAILTLQGGTIGLNQAAYGGGLFNCGTVEGKSSSISTNKGGLGSGIANVGVLNIYRNFYCSGGNPILLIPDEDGNGTITLMEEILTSSAPTVIPGIAVDDGYVEKYNLTVPLLTGESEYVAKAAECILVQKQGNTSYRLNEDGIVKMQINWLLPILVGVSLAIAAVVTVLIRRYRCKTK